MQKKFHLEIGQPTVVHQGSVGDQQWGHYQFPFLSRTEDGGIMATWEYSADTIEYKSEKTDEVRTCAVSYDEGKSWSQTSGTEKIRGFIMPNGKYFDGFVRKGAHPVDYLDKYEPVVEKNGVKIFLADDIEEKEDIAVYGIEREPVTGKETVFECKIVWPNMPLVQHPGKRVYPITMTFSLCTATGLTEINGEMFLVLYTRGLDSEAGKQSAVHKYAGYSSVYVFKSPDCGRTWCYVSQVLTTDDTFVELGGLEGNDEPMMAQMPDGSVVMLFRTGFRHPSYLVRSTDGCKTWSAPKRFDEIGVLPQIVPLGCGVTLSSYGRPVMKVRATSDPSGVEWESPIQLDLYGMQRENFMERSCFYTRWLPLCDTEALMVHTDFWYPNENGEGARAILVRRVKVVFD